ncbi:hypothetical protein TTHERM_000943052 (macronuclear) [Tetrahymena thermophila SB210]|uniref:Uncharacterized protein n=1 Tax=Tetrahymena thermophila (strain SB210) TaxID=312017 RepID=W7XDR5_TETTS|nr:hypothetical protein TTHERM_000943052 [Tetrahymena thermophila SB210]EWS75727.1 hypothetical protein TTHERM_000943052 [Tetrahymena thermophila SB210]|eukprot:XP_012651750.1 hypothetical protein TTHERM_000943052 [Tetrahymena thermophila SB210]
MYILFQILHFVSLKLSKNSKIKLFQANLALLLYYQDILYFAFYKLNRHCTLVNQKEKMKKKYEIIRFINNQQNQQIMKKKANQQIMMIISIIKIIYLNKLKDKNINNNKNNIFQLNIPKINMESLMRQK